LKIESICSLAHLPVMRICPALRRAFLFRRINADLARPVVRQADGKGQAGSAARISLRRKKRVALHFPADEKKARSVNGPGRLQ
jgi:hypothetical protein